MILWAWQCSCGHAEDGFASEPEMSAARAHHMKTHENPAQPESD